MSNITKVYKDKGGDRQVVEPGGEILLKGKMIIEAGATINDGDNVYVVVPVQDAIANLDLTAGDNYTKKDVQDIADKVDEILDALRAAKIVKAGG